jgi:molybdopterin molybdotransferase
LPGNPVSTFVIFELLVKPFLYRLMGHEYRPIEVQMRLDQPVTRKDTERLSWTPVRLTGETMVTPVSYRGSGHLTALCQADGLMRMAIGVGRVEQGVPVRVRLLREIGC